ncbi:MAG: glycosyl hydrolase [Prolixibacteraceae bacterium]
MRTGVRIILTVFVFLSCRTQDGPEPVWPEAGQETRPWTRWWWHGSAVDRAGLTSNLEEITKAGFGGVEITPIYGVRGYEEQSISFLSPEWMKMLGHTLKEGKRLKLGVDLANASGWPFGGSWITDEHACRNVHYKRYNLKGGESLREKIELIQEPYVRAVGHRVNIRDILYPVSSNANLQELALDQVRFGKPLPLQALVAYGDGAQVIELTDRVGPDGTLNWKAPAGEWRLYAVFQGWHGKQVERAGKGGEGHVIDHFSEDATRKFLNFFDEHRGNTDISGLRAFFNDSYEVDDANGESDWTPLFFEEFRKRRDYDLKRYLPALFGNDSEEVNSRVLCDYRETISDLLLDRFTRVWDEWAEKHQAQTRNQAHGSPANILDLYAASDIPETEGTELMRIKMASSAGHVTGKPLIACEAATWLNEHFRATLAEVKQNADRYLVNGVNHIVYHGTPYSPAGEAWPGWLFYAAVHFAPTNPWWNDLKVINDYIARCQSFMQKAIPANDILVYFPIYDSWSEKGKSQLVHFGKPHEPLTEDLSQMLVSQGYTFDYISDRQILQLSAGNAYIKSKGANYRTILVPSCKYMPLETMQKLIALTESGANIIFQDQLPADVPGLGRLKERQRAWRALINPAKFKKVADISVFSTGDGQMLVGSDVANLLSVLDIFPEEMAQLGLWFNRVKRVQGTCYLICNWSEKTVDQWVTICSGEKYAAWFNPITGHITKAHIEKSGDRGSRVYLQLKPGETLILQAYPYSIRLPEQPLYREPASGTALEGEWQVEFTAGGPVLPAPYKTNDLGSWTTRSEELSKFSGTASYKISFEKPAAEAFAWVLDLGKVCSSAAVFLNGEKLGSLVGPGWKLVIEPERLKKVNKLEVRVTNLMANRIINMDKEGVNYKKFYNINFAPQLRENAGKDGLFTAAGWDPLESGLIGPVSLSPLEEISLEQ